MEDELESFGPQRFENPPPLRQGARARSQAGLMIGPVRWQMSSPMKNSGDVENSVYARAMQVEKLGHAIDDMRDQLGASETAVMNSSMSV